MSHKHLFSLGGHSVTSDIGGGDIVKEIQNIFSESLLNAKLFTLFLILGNLAELSVASTPEPLHQNSGRHLVELINFHRFQADLGKLNWDMDEHTYTAREELGKTEFLEDQRILSRIKGSSLLQNPHTLKNLLFA